MGSLYSRPLDGPNEYLPIASNPPQQQMYTLSTEDIAQLHRVFSFGITPDIGLLPFQMPRMESDTPPRAKSRATVRIKNPCNLDTTTLKLVHIKEQTYRISFIYDASEDLFCRIFFYSHVKKNARGCPIRFEEGVIPQDPTEYHLNKGSRVFQQPEEDAIDFHQIPERNIHYSSVSSIVPLAIELRRKATKRIYSPEIVDRQITYGRFELNTVGTYEIKLLNQVLTTRDERVLNLKEIYGLELKSMCVICLIRPNTSALYPCRHLCLCHRCADEFKTRSENKCPLCRCFSSEVVHVIEKR